MSLQANRISKKNTVTDPVLGTQLFKGQRPKLLMKKIKKVSVNNE
jgi:hypothetical protein|tara:strand:- start:20331 stop:20465 length:135 start_codon:yes stop_codon:yes gene_type:complete